MYFLDTSAILNRAIPLFEDIYISPLTVSELEGIKNSNRPEAIKWAAREAVREIIASPHISHIPVSQRKVQRLLKKYDFLSDINDHRLLCEALILAEEQPIKFVTSDGALALFVQQFPQLELIYLQDDKEAPEEYYGWNKYHPTDEQLASLYTNPELNILKANINEYCEIYVGTELKDILRWTGQKYVSLNYKPFTSTLGEKVQPRNLEQKMYMDLLQNKDIPIKLCVAKFGTGKSWLALSHGLHEVQRGVYDKIIFVKNNLEVKGAGKLGILPGSEFEKQLPWLRQIEDHIGPQNFENMIEYGQIEPAHLSSLRGRDLKNACIIVDEAENLLVSNIQLLLGRVSDNSEIIFCADVKQCDYPEISMSGIPKMINRLKGDPLFGMVKLLKTERSAVAAKADLLD